MLLTLIEKIKARVPKRNKEDPNLDFNVDDLPSDNAPVRKGTIINFTNMNSFEAGSAVGQFLKSVDEASALGREDSVPYFDKRDQTPPENDGGMK